LPEKGRGLYAPRVLRPALVASLTVLAVTAGVALAAGNPAAGKRVYLANGCGACHTFSPAGSRGTVGPPLTRARLTADARRAKQPYALFIRTSIVKPNAYVARGYKPVMPSYSKLSRKQLDDVVAFIGRG
jgi:cytochrome c oxidase subunit II